MVFKSSQASSLPFFARDRRIIGVFLQALFIYLPMVIGNSPIGVLIADGTLFDWILGIKKSCFNTLKQLFLGVGSNLVELDAVVNYIQ